MQMVEGDIQFDFDTQVWDEKFLLKYDTCPDYRNLCGAIAKTKGVDFVGILDGRTLVFFEIKDYRGYRIASKKKIDQLDIIVARKVRDTLAGILGGVRNSTNQKELWQTYLSCLQKEANEIHVVLWMEEDASSMPVSVKQKRNHIRGGDLRTLLKKRMKWLTTKIYVASYSNNPYKDYLDVTFL